MAIPVTNIPVLTGEVAERFIEQCGSCGRVNLRLSLQSCKGGRIVFGVNQKTTN